MPIIQRLGRLRQEDHRFKVGLSCILRLVSKNSRQKVMVVLRVGVSGTAGPSHWIRLSVPSPCLKHSPSFYFHVGLMEPRQASNSLYGQRYP